MRHKLLYLSLFIVGMLCACQDEWDRHYLLGDDQNQGGSAATIWEYIVENPDYSEFVALAKANGIDSVLRKEQQMTLWVPDNEGMSVAAGMTDAEKKALLENHINYVAFKANRFTDGQQLKTLAGKNAYLSGGAGVWKIDNREITSDVAHCNNGVVHSIKGVLVPQKNIFEYVAALGDEYSMVRDTILTSCVKTFHPELSFPLGVDDVGNTIYDSVFVYESKLLAPGDIRNENEDFTMFLPDNTKIREIYDEVRSYYPELGEKDSLMIKNWIFKALIYKGKIDDYAAKKSIKSTFGLEWRTDIQQVNTADKQEFSNGYVYPIAYFRVPHFLFLKTVESWPVYRKDLEKQHPEWIDGYFKVENYGIPSDHNPYWIADAGKGIPYYLVQNNNLPDDKVLSFEWTSIDKNRFGNVVAVPLVPGRYKIKIQFRGYGTGKARLTVNGILPTDASGGDMTWFDMAAGKFDNKIGELGYITIPESAGVNPVRVRIETGKSIPNTSTKRIAVHHVVFEPDGDNY